MGNLLFPIQFEEDTRFHLNLQFTQRIKLEIEQTRSIVQSIIFRVRSENLSVNIFVQNYS